MDRDRHAAGGNQHRLHVLADEPLHLGVSARAAVAADMLAAASTAAVTAAITRIFPSRRGWAEWPSH
jgi:hypothetical protein